MAESRRRRPVKMRRRRAVAMPERMQPAWLPAGVPAASGPALALVSLFHRGERDAALAFADAAAHQLPAGEVAVTLAALAELVVATAARVPAAEGVADV